MRAQIAARARRLAQRRRQALLVFALVDIVIMYSLLDPTNRALAAATPAYRAMVAVCPLLVWGWLWGIVGLLCIVGAWTRDTIGFSAAIGIKVVWASSFFVSWAAWGVPRALVGAATWAAFGWLVYLISGWPEWEAEDVDAPVIPRARLAPDEEGPS